MSKTVFWLLPAALPFFLSACGEEAVSRPPAPRPVSVVTLKQTDPSRLLRLTGAAQAWRQEDIGFPRLSEPG